MKTNHFYKEKKYIVILVFFFILITNVLSIGISSTKIQTTLPEEEYGYKCIYLVENEEPTLSDFRFLSDFGNSKECKAIERAAYKIKNDPETSTRLSQIDYLSREITRKRYEIKRLKNEYSNMLLEKIANQDKDKSILHGSSDNAKEKIEQLNSEIESLEKKLKELKKPTKGLIEFKKIAKTYKEDILDKYNHAKRYYLLKAFGQIFLFLGPVFFLFYFLSKKVKNEIARILLKLTSYSALFLIVVYTVPLIFEVIPHVFLEKIIAWFASMNLMIVLNVIGTVFFIFIFKFILTKMTSQERSERKKREKILKGNCPECNAKNIGGSYCMNCGFEYHKLCNNCSKEIHKSSNYCIYCGDKNKQE